MYKNEDIIKSWVSEKLKNIKPGYSLKKNNLAKESAQNAFPQLYDAMKHASKKQNNERGASDFSYIIHGNTSDSDYLVLVETKADPSDVVNLNNEVLVLDQKSTVNYAANGAVWYAKQIQKETQMFPKIFAIGVAGNYERQVIVPYFVNETGGIIKLPATKSFFEFSDDQVDEYYRVNVLHKTPQSEMDAETLSHFAAQLHNDIRNYTSLKNSQKAPLVAAILLGIHSKHLTLNMLNGSSSPDNNDGAQIYNAVSDYLEQRRRQEPDFDEDKIKVILSEFKFLSINKALYVKKRALDNHSPLYKFTEDLFEVYNTVKIGDDADLLGDFYSEFVKYNDLDGNVLGIVLTPKHITSLMADLVQIGPDNYFLDPTAGSGTFLVTAMNRMTTKIKKDEDYKKNFDNIVSHHLYGVELDPSIYSVAAANMILRGDGKSNMTYGDFFKYKLKNNNNHSDEDKKEDLLFSRAPKIDRILMNPPYSQGQKAPEIKFIRHALKLLSNGGRLGVIVPISVFVSGGKGVKSEPFKEFKRWLLSDYKVEAIITMNPLTFYPTATQTVVAIISKNVGIGQGNSKTKLINFSDDGYTLIPKKGLIPNKTDKLKRKQLIDVVVNDYDAPDEFMMKVQLTEDNEWIHNAHYTNPDHPTDGDFINTLADYIAFKQDMTLHGKGDLFE